MFPLDRRVKEQLSILVQQRLESYRQLNVIADDQIAILLEQDNPQKLTRFQEKDEQRNQVVEEIESLQQEIAGLLQKEGKTRLEDLVDDDQSQGVLQAVENTREILLSLSEKQKKITEILQDQFRSLTKNMQNVKQQKNILKSYFGVDRQGVTSLYIDQKK